MPNKTIYIKDADLPLFEEAHTALGESISSLFAEFLRHRVMNLTPVERRILDLMNQIARKIEIVRNEPSLPGFIDGKYREAGTFAEKALNHLRAGQIKSAKLFFHAANTYLEGADRDAKDARELSEKIDGVLRKAAG